MKYFPLFHRLQGKRCLIIGGGKVALRRSRSLAKAGAVIDVMSPEIVPELLTQAEQSGGECQLKAFEPGGVNKNYFCIVAATDSREINQLIADFARDLKIPVNVVNNRKLCDFIFPSIVDREPVTVAISNSGASPVLSRLLKQQLDQFIPDAYGVLSEFVGQNRNEINQSIADAKTRISFWEHVLQGSIAEAIFSGKKQEAQALLRNALKSPEQFNRQGEVYLIGAGPGDPDLLTLRAFRLLQQSDVVLYDRLVSEEIMALLPDSTERIYVGKRRSQHAVPQDNINQLLVDHAKLGKRVARLKGGDPFIFGRGGEEIEELADAQIPFQVVPGITAANGCSAYAGIPLTHRDYAQSVQFVTGQLKDGSIDLNWSELIAIDKTLVFYMGLNSLPLICQSLISNGMDSVMPVALIEKGTTTSQRVLISSLSGLPGLLKEQSISSPSLLIVGNVVKLAEKLHWYESDHEQA